MHFEMIGQFAVVRGRHRKVHDDAEKIRKGVSNAITRAIEAIRMIRGERNSCKRNLSWSQTNFNERLALAVVPICFRELIFQILYTRAVIFKGCRVQ